MVKNHQDAGHWLETEKNEKNIWPFSFSNSARVMYAPNFPHKGTIFYPYFQVFAAIFKKWVKHKNCIDCNNKSNNFS